MSLRPSERADVRRRNYKTAVGSEKGLRRRKDNMVEIRKSKREENLLKKRKDQGFSDRNSALERLAEIVARVNSDDIGLQFAATVHLRNFLSLGDNPPIDKVIRSGVVPHLMEFLKREDFLQ